MKYSKPTIACLTFLLCCLLSSARLVVDAPGPGHLRDDPVARRSDQRFARLKVELPPRGVIGYIGTEGTPGLADYYLAQYALAPLVLDRSPNHSIVVANFPDSLRTAPQDLHLVKDFGNGLLLFSNKDAH